MATTESDEPDTNVVRLDKFRRINKRGHASHSSVQNILYYGSNSNTSLDNGFAGNVPFLSG